MWILPSTICPSAPAGPDSILALDSQSLKFAPSAGLNGKLSPLTSWRRAWKRDAYIRRLFSRTSVHSMGDPGLASWIASLRATRANRSVAPEIAVDKTIRDICGPTSVASLAKLGRASCFSKTYPGISASGRKKFLGNWKTWVTELRAASLRRRKSAPPISENDCLSSAWKTPHGMAGIDHTGKKGSGGEFAKQCTQWPTPRAAENGNDSGSQQQQQRQQQGANPGLKTLAKQWQTPNTQKGGGKTRGQDRKDEPLLPAQAEATAQALTTIWPTARASDYRSGSVSETTSSKNSRPLCEAVVNSPCSRLDLTTSTPGSPSSTKRRTCGPQLNPVFVSWLMGWPPIAPSGSSSLEMAWSRWRRRMRSALCGLLSRWSEACS